MQLTRQAKRDLQGFLDLWRSTNLGVAAKRYLTASEQPVGDGRNFRLAAGKVDSIQLVSWQSADDFMLIVTLDLRFAAGSAAWTNGVNTRFVTVSRASAAEQFRYEFATGP